MPVTFYWQDSIVAGPDTGKFQQHTPSGRVRHDSGGRAVWEWAVESGRNAIDSTSRLLKKLNLSELSLVDDEKPVTSNAAVVAHPEKDPAAGSPVSGRIVNPRLAVKNERPPSFNPYDSHTPTGRGVSRTARPVSPPKPRITQPPRDSFKRGFLARLFGRR